MNLLFLRTTKELYLFKLSANDFKKRDFKKSEKPLEATKIYERYQNYMKYVNLAPDSYKIASLINGFLIKNIKTLTKTINKYRWIISDISFPYLLLLFKNAIYTRGETIGLYSNSL